MLGTWYHKRIALDSHFSARIGARKRTRIKQFTKVVVQLAYSPLVA